MPLHLVHLTPLMARTSGRPDVGIGLLDGPVAINHPGLYGSRISVVSQNAQNTGLEAHSVARRHGTFIAGILSGTRGGDAPAICPNCTVLAHSIFTQAASGASPTPTATPADFTRGLMELVTSGVRVVNLSLALSGPTVGQNTGITEVLDEAARRSVIIVAAAGNQGTLGGSGITRHPWVIPVTACDAIGKPDDWSTIGHSIGQRGLRAPGQLIKSLDAEGSVTLSSGTSVATPFVTGTIALIWSMFPGASASLVRDAVTRATEEQRAAVVPPLLDAWAAYRRLAAHF